MNRRVLVVVSSYKPAMNADMHRARHLGWTLRETGWNMEVLSPSASFQRREQIEPESDDFFCKDVPVHFVEKKTRSLFRYLGINSVGWRSFFAMYKAGMRLLRDKKFDLIYISTTNSPLLLLGPLWRARCGVPFVIDIHDPIHKQGRKSPSWARSTLKHRLANWLGGLIEAICVKQSAGLVSVSPTYLDRLQARYAAIRNRPHAVIPFSVLPRDHELAANEDKTDFGGNRLSIVYVGAGGNVMARAFSLLCDTLAALHNDERALDKSMRFELYGTQMGWRDGGTKHLHDIARTHGVGDLVFESPRRVTYRRSLEILCGSDGAIVLGVDDAGYMPSKLYSYAYSGKPLLAVVRKDGPAFTALQELGETVHTIWFDKNSQMPPEEAAGVLAKFLREVTSRRQFDRHEIPERHGTSAMARRHADLFYSIVCGPKTG